MSLLFLQLFFSGSICPLISWWHFHVHLMIALAHSDCVRVQLHVMFTFLIFSFSPSLPLCTFLDFLSLSRFPFASISDLSWTKDCIQTCRARDTSPAPLAGQQVSAKSICGHLARTNDCRPWQVSGSLSLVLFHSLSALISLATNFRPLRVRLLYVTSVAFLVSHLLNNRQFVDVIVSKHTDHTHRQLNSQEEHGTHTTTDHCHR